MKVMIILTLFASLLFAETRYLPYAGTYSCSGERAFNNPPSTFDSVSFDLSYTLEGVPTMKIKPSGSFDEATLGSGKWSPLQPTQISYCNSGDHTRQVTGCALAKLLPVSDTNNLYIGNAGNGYVGSIKISGNFKSYYSDTQKIAYPNLSTAILVEYRKNGSHWERPYLCHKIK